MRVLALITLAQSLRLRGPHADVAFPQLSEEQALTHQSTNKHLSVQQGHGPSVALPLAADEDMLELRSDAEGESMLQLSTKIADPASIIFIGVVKTLSLVLDAVSFGVTIARKVQADNVVKTMQAAANERELLRTEGCLEMRRFQQMAWGLSLATQGSVLGLTTKLAQRREITDDAGQWITKELMDLVKNVEEAAETGVLLACYESANDLKGQVGTSARAKKMDELSKEMRVNKLFFAGAVVGLIGDSASLGLAIESLKDGTVTAPPNTDEGKAQMYVTAIKDFAALKIPRKIDKADREGKKKTGWSEDDDEKFARKADEAMSNVVFALSALDTVRKAAGSANPVALYVGSVVSLAKSAVSLGANIHRYRKESKIATSLTSDVQANGDAFKHTYTYRTCSAALNLKTAVAELRAQLLLGVKMLKPDGELTLPGSSEPVEQETRSDFGGGELSHDFSIDVDDTSTFTFSRLQGAWTKQLQDFCDAHMNFCLSSLVEGAQTGEADRAFYREILGDARVTRMQTEDASGPISDIMVASTPDHAEQLRALGFRAEFMFSSARQVFVCRACSDRVVTQILQAGEHQSVQEFVKEQASSNGRLVSEALQDAPLAPVWIPKDKDSGYASLKEHGLHMLAVLGPRGSSSGKPVVFALRLASALAHSTTNAKNEIKIYGDPEVGKRRREIGLDDDDEYEESVWIKPNEQHASKVSDDDVSVLRVYATFREVGGSVRVPSYTELAWHSGPCSADVKYDVALVNQAELSKSPVQIFAVGERRLDVGKPKQYCGTRTSTIPDMPSMELPQATASVRACVLKSKDKDGKDATAEQVALFLACASAAEKDGYTALTPEVLEHAAKPLPEKFGTFPKTAPEEVKKRYPGMMAIPYEAKDKKKRFALIFYQPTASPLPLQLPTIPEGVQPREQLPDDQLSLASSTDSFGSVDSVGSFSREDSITVTDLADAQQQLADRATGLTEGLDGFLSGHECNVQDAMAEFAPSPVSEELWKKLTVLDGKALAIKKWKEAKGDAYRTFRDDEVLHRIFVGKERRASAALIAGEITTGTTPVAIHGNNEESLAFKIVDLVEHSDAHGILWNNREGVGYLDVTPDPDTCDDCKCVQDENGPRKVLRASVETVAGAASQLKIGCTDEKNEEFTPPEDTWVMELKVTFQESKDGTTPAPGELHEALHDDQASGRKALSKAGFMRSPALTHIAPLSYECTNTVVFPCTDGKKGTWYIERTLWVHAKQFLHGPPEKKTTSEL